MSPAASSLRSVLAAEHHRRALGVGLAVWLITALALHLLQPLLGLAATALLLVLATLVAGLSWPLRLNLPAALLAVLGFNWSFVPPRGTLQVALHEHVLLLLTLGLCALALSTLAARQQRALVLAREQHRHGEQQRRLMAALRDGTPALQALAAQLAELAEPVQLLRAGASPDPAVADAHVRGGLEQSARLGQAFGPGTGRHEGEALHYLPLRGRQASLGAAALPALADDERLQAQALCDLAGLALERSEAEQAATTAEANAREQALRNTLLAAIAHDHRTPLAAIVGSASSLLSQGDRIDALSRKRLAEQILAEAERLRRITDNSLQLARLGAGTSALQRDWESAEELVGSLLARTRARDPRLRLKAFVEPHLPLLRGDAVLLLQMLDNLVDNALRHGGDAAVEIRAERQGEALLLSVLDRGAGPPAAQEAERLFQAFQPGPGGGSGLGLALARAVAEAHGGSLHWRTREGGGSRFDCRLPAAS